MTQADRNLLQRHLEQALNAPLKPEVATLGTRLLARLQTRVTIAVVGRQGVGKSCLCAVMAQLAELADCVVTEITVPTDGADRLDALHLAEIVVWCGQGFGPTDQAIWSAVPDRLKDHSFFVLTKADSLAARGQLHGTLSAVGKAIGDAFLGVFPVATLQALMALGPDPNGTVASYRASGAAALSAALARQLVQAQDAVRDGAVVFLNRYGRVDLAAVSQVITVPNLWQVPFAYLQRRAHDLGFAQSLAGPQRVVQVIDQCCVTVEGLVDLVLAEPRLAAAQSGLVEDILAVADTMVLMRVEGDAKSAIDAMALLLQLRRDIAMQAIS